MVPHTLFGPTPPVYGIPDTKPFQAPDSSSEHVTNIARMEALLREHPEVDQVTRYKIDKSLDHSNKNPADGRTLKGGGTKVHTTCASASQPLARSWNLDAPLTR